MSVFRHSGRFKFRTQGLQGAISLQLGLVDLRPVSRVTYTFDPFHPRVEDFRNLMFYLSSPKIRETNHKCVFKTEVVSDRSNPEIHCKLENGKQLLFKTENLSALEILEQLNRILKPLLPPKEVIPAPPRKRLR